MLQKKTWFIRLDHHFPLLCGPVLMFMCPLLMLSAVDRGQQVPAFAPYMHQWVLAAHDPVTGSLLFLSWTNFDRYWPLHTGNTPQELQFWRCFDPVVEPSQFGLYQTRSNPYTSSFFLPLKHQLLGQHVYLLPNISHPLTGAMMKR